VAANHLGRTAIEKLAHASGGPAFARHLAALAEHAERLARAALAARPDGDFEATEHLDDGSPIRVRVVVSGDGATIDFAGSAAQHPGNLNATPAIVRSAVMYVLRLLIGAGADGGPLNEGIMRPVTLRVPPGILDPDFPADPARAPAVVGGNVETSQRIVDTLLKALGLAACSQGTMNNVLFGAGDFGYYETVGGGAGAGPGFPGASGVHTHMTNTGATDPEVLEHRYPVRLEQFAIRAGSGGRGRWPGGEGLIRRYLFERPCSLSLLTQHRREGPYGLAGGGPGLPGAQRVVRACGAVVHLGPSDGCEVEGGDLLVLETPGGGGYGAPV
jgi:5-oxoprolinase (ATP-hydrolysing)